MRVFIFLGNFFVFFVLFVKGLLSQDFISFLETFLIEIQYSTVRYNKTQPWKVEVGDDYRQYGILIDSQMVLTQCDELPHAITIHVEYKKKRYVGTLEFADFEINFCIINVKGLEVKDFHWRKIPFGVEPSIKQNIQVAFYENQKITTKNFVVSEYNLTSDYGFTRLPIFSVASSESLIVGSIAFVKDKIIGFFSYKGEKKLHFVPVSRIVHFLETYSKKTYQGFVVGGTQLEPLRDDAKIYFGLSEEDQACMIKEILVGSSAYGFLNVGDVILEIDGIKPKMDCLYDDPLLGLQDWELLFSRKTDGSYRKPEEKIKVKLLRQFKPMEVEIVLRSFFASTSHPERIPWKVYGTQPYIVILGFVFIELSHSFLVERFGKQWRSRAIELAFLYDTKRHYKDHNEKDKVVIISDILHHPVNVGLNNFQFKPIAKINRKPIFNLKHFYSIIQEHQEQIIEIEFSDKRKLYLDLSKKEEHQQILKTYQIPKDVFLN
ncbi:MAG: hypothetical protein NZ853_04955 [Leptospiraceae bacterium]|nr:hypothetical protein [Leptospiraceae bacterium]MDW7976704.1 hypothetical protein [Leptospiraceae bacterium]